MFVADGTHLSNVAGDKKEWPVYMTIGNLSSKIRQMPSTHSVVIVALLPIPIKNRDIPQKPVDEQRQINSEVLNKVPRWVLQQFSSKQHPSAKSGHYNVLCADGNFRHCKPVLAAWLADCPEYSDHIISCGMSVFSPSVQRTNLEMMCILSSSTPGGITTYIECSVMPTPRQPMPNSVCAMLTENSMYFNTFPVL
jgi:hypothetical protein